MQPVRI